MRARRTITKHLTQTALALLGLILPAGCTPGAVWFACYSSDRQQDPAGPASGDSRIPRGGSWYDTPADVRSANRGENSPDYTRHKVGFRCAMDVE